MTARPPSTCAASAELVEAEAWAQMQSARSTELRERLGVAVHRHDGATTLIARHCAELSVNRVFALGIRSPGTRDLIDAVMREYRDAGVPRFIIQVSPVTQPAELRDWLGERGFVRRGGLLKLARSTDDASTLSATHDVGVVEITADESDVFEEIVAAPLQVPREMRHGMSATIGLPGWRYYLAYRGAQPIAGAAMYAGDQAAWCGLAATLQSERGRGAQSALFVRRIQDAAAAGCGWITAETLPERPDRPNPSLRNMTRLGFELLYEREVHVHGVPVNASA
jgi:hypothetical protein